VSADIVAFDLTPGAVAEIAGDRLPDRVAVPIAATGTAGRLQGGSGGGGGSAVDERGCRKAGTVHVIGSFEELVAAERDINRGRMPERPFILVGQQYLADP